MTGSRTSFGVSPAALGRCFFAAGAIILSTNCPAPLFASAPPTPSVSHLDKADAAFVYQGLHLRNWSNHEGAVLQFDHCKHPQEASDRELACMGDSYNLCNQGAKSLALMNIFVKRCEGDKKRLLGRPNPYPLSVRADALNCLGRLDEAVAEDEKLAALIPGDGGKLYLAKAADILKRQKKFKESIALFSRCLKLAPTPEDVLLFLNRGVCYREVDNYPAAIGDFTSAIKLARQPGRTNGKALLWAQANAFNERAKCYAHLGKRAEAAADERERDKMGRTVEDELFGK